MKEEAIKGVGPFGLMSVIFGIQGVVFGVFYGFVGIPVALIFGILGLIFGVKQKRMHASGWSKTGIILNVISIVAGVIMLVLFASWLISFINYLNGNPAILAQMQATP